jgi:CDP-4-dehydro-6-deoxyglucose reductase
MLGALKVTRREMQENRMPKALSLSRAARLAGVSRGELQERVREMDIPTFEGKIAVEQLLRAYPSIDMDRDPVLERIDLIKAKARPKTRYTDQWLPEPGVLMARLQDFQSVLSRTKAAVNTGEQLLKEVVERLDAATKGDDALLRETARHLTARLRQAMAKAEARPDQEAELFAKDALLRIMSASVRVLPSEHEFFVQGRDSLLGAALKAGLHLSYGCSSGNCGTCKVRVLRGETRTVREHDYVLSAQEKADGFVLACSSTAVTDVLIEASEAFTPQDLPQQQVRCTVRKLEPVSDELTLVHVQTPRTQTLRFMAGQHVRLTLEDGHHRDLAVASCPCDARNLQFLVRSAPGDGFSDGLLGAASGETVLVEGPRGSFLLEEEATEPAVFVAVDDGFAPIKSLIEHAIAIDNVSRMYLYRIDDIPRGGVFGNLCRSWDDALDNFTYKRLDARTPPATALAEIKQDIPSLADARVYLAGPGQWVGEFAALAGTELARPDLLRTEETGATL